MTEEDMVKLIKAQIKYCGSQRKWAIKLGITPQYVNDIVHGRRGVSGEVAKAMGYQRIVSYCPIKELGE